MPEMDDDLPRDLLTPAEAEQRLLAMRERVGRLHIACPQTAFEIRVEEALEDIQAAFARLEDIMREHAE